ncbi:MAG: hypothetical protein AB1551_07105 [Actinomycetota bacterium]
MTDLERQVRELLDEKSRESHVTPRAPKEVLRRARWRQTLVGLVTAVTVAAVVTGSIAGLSAVVGPSEPDVVIGGTDSRTVTMAGVTVTYPSEWTMVDLWPLAQSIVTSEVLTVSGPDGSTTWQETPIDIPSGLPVFQLSSTDLGLGPTCWSGNDILRPLPDTEAFLYVAYDIDALQRPDLPTGSWPVELQSGSGVCGDGYYARWVSSRGTPYLAFAGFGPNVSAEDRQAVFDAFASMSFHALELNTLPAESVPGYVIDGVYVGDLEYTLEVRPAADGGLDMSLVNGRQPEVAIAGLGGVGNPGDPDVQYNVSAVVRLTDDGTPVDVGSVAFGVVSERVAAVEARVPGAGTFPGTIVPIPSSLGSSYRAFRVEMPGSPRGTLIALDADGNVIAEEPLAPAEPTSEPTPGFSADWAQSSLRISLTVAKVYFTDAASYAGFDPKAAVSIEPTLTYNTSTTALVGEISIRAVTDSTILLVTRSFDGRLWCIADHTDENGRTWYGTTDAQSIAECHGDVPVWG